MSMVYGVCVCWARCAQLYFYYVRVSSDCATFKTILCGQNAWNNRWIYLYAAAAVVIVIITVLIYDCEKFKYELCTNDLRVRMLFRTLLKDKRQTTHKRLHGDISRILFFSRINNFVVFTCKRFLNNFRFPHFYATTFRSNAYAFMHEVKLCVGWE